jgi:hypothetical protein
MTLDTAATRVALGNKRRERFAEGWLALLMNALNQPAIDFVSAAHCPAYRAIRARAIIATTSEYDSLATVGRLR